MTRVEYWFRAKNQYGLHSPYMFELYCDVLHAVLTRGDRRRLRRAVGRCTCGEWRYYVLLYKLACHFRATDATLQAEGDAVRRCLAMACEGMRVTVADESEGLAWIRLTAADGQRLAVVLKPHGSRAAEREWERMKQLDDYNVSVDLYDTGLLIANKHLSRQAFILM